MTFLGSCFGLWGTPPPEVPGGACRGSPELKLSPSLVAPACQERIADFRRKDEPLEARLAGACKIRDGWGGWILAYLVVDVGGHRLEVHHSDGSGVPPPPGAQPHRAIDLMGAAVAASRKEEVALTPLRGSQLTILARSMREREEWMAGLGRVPGISRRLADYYTLGQPLGQGAVCLVRECWHKHTRQRLAIKSRLHSTRESSEHMRNELHILQLCAKQPHPAIPHLHDFFSDADGSVVIVTDLLQGGDLYDYLSQQEQDLEEGEVRGIFRALVEGVEHLHSLGVVHRDLKPENIMFASAPGEGGQLKVMDYDVAKLAPSPAWQDAPVGTTYYMAPEVISRQQYSRAADMWSLGVSLYILFSGCMPFKGETVQATEAQILRGAYSTRQEVWDRVSPEALDLLSRLLELDPSRRISAAECLRHAWLTQPPRSAPAAAVREAAEG